jgi:arsenate reductase
MSTYNVLYVCTGNCCRSQIAEALTRGLAPGRFKAFSAGLEPAGFVHPLATMAAERMGFDTVSQYSKGLDEIKADHLDIVIRLSEKEPDEAYAQLPGDPIVVHWDLPDPSFYEGEEEQRLQFVMEVAELLRQRIERMVHLQIEEMTDERLHEELQHMAKV